MVLLKHYTWLIILSVFAVWSSTQIVSWPESIQEILVFFPYVAVILGGFIALWLNRVQPVLILLSIGCFNALLFYFSSLSIHSESLVEALFLVLSLLFPFNILLWILLPEKGIFNKHLNLLIGVVFLVQGVLIYGLIYGLFSKELLMLLGMPAVQYSNVIALPFSVGIVFALALFFIVLRLSQSSFKILYHAILVVLILMLVGIAQGLNLSMLAWFSTFAAIILTLAIIFEAHRIAYTDELTGILGRRALMEFFLGLNKKYVIAMIDIDYFKKINDRYGHSVGDEVLRCVAQALDSVKGGNAFRYGGEEFTIVFANKTLDEVISELEYIRRNIESNILEIRMGGNLIQTNVTVSIGVAESDRDLYSVQDVLKLADKGLYEAKKTGRNQVVVSEYSLSSPKVSHYKRVKYNK